MFGSIPSAVIKVPISEYRRMRAYYRIVSNWKPDTGVTVEQTGDKIEEGAVIVE